MSPVERNVGGLRCSQVLERLSDWIDGDLGESEAVRVREHLAGCDTCARFGADFRALIGRFREGGGPVFEADRGSRLRRALHSRTGGGDASPT